MTMENAKRQADEVTGVSNLTYDVMTVLTNKLQGIAAIEVYKLDAQQEGDREVQALLEEIQQGDREDVERLRAMVAQRLR
jgi:hypothetical protein